MKSKNGLKRMTMTRGEEFSEPTLKIYWPNVLGIPNHFDLFQCWESRLCNATTFKKCPVNCSVYAIRLIFPAISFYLLLSWSYQLKEYFTLCTSCYIM